MEGRGEERRGKERRKILFLHEVTSALWLMGSMGDETSVGSGRDHANFYGI